jgi:hypothetical protein
MLLTTLVTAVSRGMKITGNCQLIFDLSKLKMRWFHCGEL